MEGTEFKVYCPFSEFTQGQNTKNKIEIFQSWYNPRGKCEQERGNEARKKGKHMRGGWVHYLGTPDNRCSRLLQNDRGSQRDLTNSRQSVRGKGGQKNLSVHASSFTVSGWSEFAPWSINIHVLFVTVPHWAVLGNNWTGLSPQSSNLPNVQVP